MNGNSKEYKIRKWISERGDKKFKAKDIAEAIKLTPVEVGGHLKFLDGLVGIVEYDGHTAIWQKVTE